MHFFQKYGISCTLSIHPFFCFVFCHEFSRLLFLYYKNDQDRTENNVLGPCFNAGFCSHQQTFPFCRFRVYQCRVRQLALHCMLAVVKAVEKRTLYGYWSSFIPYSPAGGPPSLTLLTIILKDPSPKVQPVTNICFGFHQDV